MTNQEPLRLRVGRKVGRTLYRLLPGGGEELVGLVDTPDLAAQVVEAVNGQDVGRVRADERERPARHVERVAPGSRPPPTVALRR